MKKERWKNKWKKNGEGSEKVGRLGRGEDSRRERKDFRTERGEDGERERMEKEENMERRGQIKEVDGEIQRRKKWRG